MTMVKYLSLNVRAQKYGRDTRINLHRCFENNNIVYVYLCPVGKLCSYLSLCCEAIYIVPRSTATVVIVGSNLCQECAGPPYTPLSWLPSVDPTYLCGTWLVKLLYQYLQSNPQPATCSHVSNFQQQEWLVLYLNILIYGKKNSQTSSPPVCISYSTVGSNEFFLA